MAQNDEIVSYIMFTRAGERLIKGSSKNDYYTIFLWTFPQFRCKGYASLMAKVMLNDLGIEYRFFYKTIAKDNSFSIMVAEKSGFKKISDANKTGLTHKIVSVDEGKQFLYRAEKE